MAPISTFTSDDEVIAKANDTEYGLVGYVFTRDLQRALRFAEGIEAGMVGINQGMVSTTAGPFGGVKQSGLGREGGFTGHRRVPRAEAGLHRRPVTPEMRP